LLLYTYIHSDPTRSKFKGNKMLMFVDPCIIVNSLRNIQQDATM